MSEQVLVVGAQKDGVLLPSTAHAVTAGRTLGPVAVLVMGEEIEEAAAMAARLAGVEEVIQVQERALQGATAELAAEVVAAWAAERRYVVFPATSFGKDVAPRVAALLDRPMVSEVVQVVDATTFVRPIYAGNALATVVCEEPLVISVRTTAFAPAAEGGAQGRIRRVRVQLPQARSRVVQRKSHASHRPDLTTARVVVTGGRGLGSAEAFEKVLGPLADRLHAAIGTTRAAVEAGYAPSNWQIGQTGNVVAPELYVAIGVSGAVQHLAGIRGSRVIVAINKDPEAPIFEVADYGLVGDLFTAVPELIARLGKN